jgi:acyl carrier protein
MALDPAILGDVTAVIVRTLGIEDRAATLTAATPLFGAMPELDSLAVLELVTQLEARFGIAIDDEDITGEVFETVGSLAQYVHQSVAAKG